MDNPTKKLKRKSDEQNEPCRKRISGLKDKEEELEQTIKNT